MLPRRAKRRLQHEVDLAEVRIEAVTEDGEADWRSAVDWHTKR